MGRALVERVKEQLATLLHPSSRARGIFAYLWARTVACPVTGKPVPLSPNWWLRKGSDPAAVRLIAEPGMDAPAFASCAAGEVCAKAKPDEGTISRGVGRSPWTGEPIDGDYIKAEAQAGRMGQMLYAVAVKGPGGFRLPRADRGRGSEACGERAKRLARNASNGSGKGLAIDEENSLRPTRHERDDDCPVYGMPTGQTLLATSTASYGTYCLKNCEERSREDVAKLDREANFIFLSRHLP